MYRLTRLGLGGKTLAQMFRKLKLAGAHPDVLWSIDAAKAQHNGEEMIRLETLMYERENRLLRGTHASGVSRSTSTSSGGGGVPFDREGSVCDGAPVPFLFWMQDHAGGGGSLRAVQCMVSPNADNAIVKRQLTRLFDEAGILEEFDLAEGQGEGGTAGEAADLRTVLRRAEERQVAHLQQTGALYIRGDRAIAELRRYGVLLAVEQGGMSYLVTLPDAENSRPAIDDTILNTTTAHDRQLRGLGLTHSIIGPQGEMAPEVVRFLEEHDMQPFDLRLAGGAAAVERLVTAFERLERLYEVHRGGAMRSGVCLVISLSAPDHYVAGDGCLVLAAQRQPGWEEFLLALPHQVWAECVRQHAAWRLGAAPRWATRRRHCLRLADIFHVCRVTVAAPLGGPLWQEAFIHALLTEEVAIRRAVRRYGLQSDWAKKRLQLRFEDALVSDSRPSHGAVLDYSIGVDGVVRFNRQRVNAGQVLRVLKDNLHHVAQMTRTYDTAVKRLEHLSRTVPLDFSVDTAWKSRTPRQTFLRELTSFVDNVTRHGPLLAASLQHAPRRAEGNARVHAKHHESARAELSGEARRRMWVISDKLDLLPSGVMFVPYDADVGSLARQFLLVDARS